MRREFIERVPEVEIRADLAFIDCEQGQCVMAPATLKQFVVVASAALARWQVSKLDQKVVSIR